MKPDELEGYERVVGSREYDGTYIKRIVLRLVKEVRRLDAWDKHLMYQWDESVKELTAYISKVEAERDWLAMSNSDRCCNNKRCPEPDKECSDCWIDAAKEAVKRD